MIEVMREGTDIVIRIPEDELEDDEKGGLVSFLMTAPCRHPKHIHEQILQGLLKLRGQEDHLTTSQREKLRIMGVIT